MACVAQTPPDQLTPKHNLRPPPVLISRQAVQEPRPTIPHSDGLRRGRLVRKGEMAIAEIGDGGCECVR